MPKPNIKIGVMSEPPPTPVRPTTKPTKKPERMNAMSVMGMDFAALPLKTKLLFCCWLMRISLGWFLHMGLVGAHAFTCDQFNCLNCFAFARAAHLLRNVPEKAEAFLRWALLPASDELLIFCSDLCMVGRARPAKGLSFFRPITERVWVIGASLRALNFVAHRAINTPAICHFGFKLPLKNATTRPHSRSAT
jgi:hypothetical protein